MYKFSPGSLPDFSYNVLIELTAIDYPYVLLKIPNMKNPSLLLLF